MRLENIRAVLFDKDGTLLDYEASWGPLNRRAAAYASRGDLALANRISAFCGIDAVSGRTLPDSLFAAGSTEELATAMVSLGSPFSVEELRDALDGIFVSGADEAVAVKGMADILSQLKSAGFLVGIASSDSEAAIHRMLRRFGLSEDIDFVAGYDSGHGPKPEPGMALAFCRAVCCEPAQMAMVGDNRHDIVMGRAAGAGAIIAVLTGTGTEESLAPLADICIASIAGLPPLLGLR